MSDGNAEVLDFLRERFNRVDEQLERIERLLDLIAGPADAGAAPHHATPRLDRLERS